MHPDPRIRKYFIMMSLGAGLIASGLLLVWGFGNDHDQTATAGFDAVPAEMDYPAPDLSLVDLDGDPVSLMDVRGRVVLVNLWATWCLPCREEMPVLQAFYENHREDDLVLIGINQEEARETVLSFVEELGLAFPIWLDPGTLTQRQFKTTYLPTSYVIDRAGQVRLMWFGSISEKNLETFVLPLLDE